MPNTTSTLDKLFKKATSKHNAKNYVAAENFYKKILKISASHVDANYMLGSLYAEQNRLSKALLHTQKAQQFAPTSPYIHNNLGNIYRLSGDFENAEKHYLAALSIKTDLIEAYNNLAILYRRQQKISNAIELYLQALAINPDFVAARYNLGKTYLIINEFAQAKACFDKILAHTPNHALSHNELGNCYMRTHESEQAIGHFNSYLALVKNDECGVKMKLAYLNSGEMPARLAPEIVTQTYEQKATTWDQDIKRPNMEFLGPQIIAATVEKTRQKFPHQAILDLGCGTGICGELLKPYIASIVGIDLSPHMLKIAQQKSIYTQLVCMDIESYLSSSTEQFDLIVGSGILIFFADLHKIIDAVAQRLSTDGIFIFTLYKSDNGNISIRNNIHFAHSISHIEDCAKQAGLNVELTNEVIHEFDFGQPQWGYAVVLRKA